MKSGYFSLGGAFLEGVDDDMDVIDINMVKKNAANLMDYSDKISMNGYEGVFDSFNCMCFFTFENIFDIRKRLSITSNYYNKFQKNILDNFTEEGCPEPANVTEIKHGEWISVPETWGAFDIRYYCSECGKDAIINNNERYVLSDYCPHCGAIMDEGKKEK